ncbi:MAG: ATP-dependent RecD-like DNA helicase [Bacilli bacterium]|nr:ATP-dependent RecD-like DNA helicase [Bacilli bacterium]
MSYIKGKYRKAIYETDAGYKVGLFRVYETDDKDIQINKTITFIGYFDELLTNATYIFHGKYISHDRYGRQFQTTSYEKVKPEEKEAIIEFLTSSFVKGCGIKTAEKLVNLFGKDTLAKIKENESNLLLVPNLSARTAKSIYNSVIKYYETDEYIVYLQNLGFTIKETMKLIKTYDKDIKKVVEENIYILTDLIEFKKLDQIFLLNNKLDDERRVEATIIESMKSLSFQNGDIYLDKIDIVEHLANHYQIYIVIDEILKKLYLNKKIIITNDDYYLIDEYLDEVNNADVIKKLINKPILKIKPIEDYFIKLNKELKITYNDEQKLAIKRALENNISIITGGPGTGKTTIIKGIIKIYGWLNNLSDKSIHKDVLLLAPTGRAAKRMSETTNLPASTIHRFLKWDKERNIFGINEFNKLYYKLIIIDETSMIDNHLLSALFKGLDLRTQIVFVGDEYQLPSVGPGLVLNDIINSDAITHTRLENIYRQSENSYIPVLAKEIKQVNIDEDLLIKRDDYNFIEVANSEVKNIIKQIITKGLEKGLNETNFQVLAPMYKGENGIDNLNILLQNLYNPFKANKYEISYFGVIFREGDKVLNLVNDLDLNIYNGDIGYIKEVNKNSKTDILVIDYENNLVSYKKESLNTITHAYAISIHKSQGSEFEHVIIPITFGYSRMLFNKLLYTGVSRAKKSLILVGNSRAFATSITNNYSEIRKTSLKRRILE